MRATRMTDVGRLADLLDRAQETMVHVALDRVSPAGGAGAGHDRPRAHRRRAAVDDSLLIEAESLAEIAMRVD